jgi:hypothetical protein
VVCLKVDTCSTMVITFWVSKFVSQLLEGKMGFYDV